jgi:hypothetical protein
MSGLSELFLETLKNLSKFGGYKSCYTIHHGGNGSFYNVDLSRLVFVAQNEYQLYLMVYNYMKKHSSFYKKIVIRNDLDSEELTESVEYVYEGENKDNDKYYDMVSEEYLKSFEVDDVEELVEIVMLDFFENEELWARKISDNFLTEEEEDENDNICDEDEEYEEDKEEDKEDDEDGDEEYEEDEEEDKEEEDEEYEEDKEEEDNKDDDE